MISKIFSRSRWIKAKLAPRIQKHLIAAPGACIVCAESMGKAPRRGVNDPRSQKPRGPDRSAYLPPLAGAERVIFGGSLAGNVCSSCLSNSSSSSRLSRCSRVSISLVTTNLSYLGGQPSPLTFSATALNAWLGEWISCGKGCDRKTKPLLHCGTRFGASDLRARARDAAHARFTSGFVDTPSCEEIAWKLD